MGGEILGGEILKPEPPTEGLAYFESLQLLEGRRFSSIESAQRLLAALGNPQNRVPAIHVAGTNGKGTVCALLASMFRAQGYNVGQTSSPHLTHVSERCLINGLPAPDYGEAIETVVAVAMREDLAPSYFVLGVVAAFYEFARKKLDWMMVEVGVGGLLDATNTIARPRATVITNISADHTDVLGTHLPDIARKKAGIAKLGVPMFVGEVSTDVRAAIEQMVGEVGAPTEYYGREFHYFADSDRLRTGPSESDAHLRDLTIDGEHQKRNAALAVRVATALGISERARAEGIRRARWPGRLEYFMVEFGSTTVLMDVAHNPGGIQVLCDYLRSKYRETYQKLIFLVSVVSRKDWRQILRQLKEVEEFCGGPQDWIFTHSEHPEAVAPEELAQFFGRGTVDANPDSALALALERASADTLIVITGSVFLAGRLRPKLTSAPFSTIAAADSAG